MTSGSRHLAILFVAGILAAPAESVDGTLLRHKSPTFTIEVPTGYERITTNQLPQTLYSFGEPVDGSSPRLNFSLQDLGRPFRPRRLRLEDMPAEFRAQDSSIEDWNCAGMTLSTVVTKQRYGRLDLISFTILIPVIDRGLQINVTGAADREQDARRLLDQLLGSLKADLIGAPVEAQAFAPSTGVRGVFAWMGIAGTLGLVLYGTIRFFFWSGERRLSLGGARLKSLVAIIILLLPSALYQLVGTNRQMPYWLQASGGAVKLLLAVWALIIHISLMRELKKRSVLVG